MNLIYNASNVEEVDDWFESYPICDSNNKDVELERFEFSHIFDLSNDEEQSDGIELNLFLFK